MRWTLCLAMTVLAYPALAEVKPAQQPFRPATVQAGTARPATVEMQASGLSGRQVVMPETTEGTRRVNALRSEHRAGSVMALASAQAAQLKPSNERQTMLAHIMSINDKSFASTWIVPGAAYVIKGWGFGTTPGEVKLIGRFPGSAPKFRIDLWQDGVIHAYLEDDISGAYDQQDVTLAIIAPGVLWTRKNVKFLAAREVRAFDLRSDFETRLSEHPDAKTFSTQRTVTRQNGLLRVRGRMDWSIPQDSYYNTPGCSGSVGTFKLGGTDTFKIQNFKPGWSAVGLEWYVGRAEPPSRVDYQGQPGTSGSALPEAYTVQLQPTKITVEWAVYNSMTQKACSEPNPAFAITEYHIKGFAEGPRGTAMF